jgi:hypothetical protein
MRLGKHAVLRFPTPPAIALIRQTGEKRKNRQTNGLCRSVWSCYPLPYKLSGR